MKLHAHHIIGIWGHGVTGASYLRYCQRNGLRNLHLFDDNPLPPAVRTTLHSQGVRTYLPAERSIFIETVEYILASPGIDITSADIAQKIVPEYLLFTTEWTGKIVAITGTVGKTTITHTLGHLLTQSGLQKVYVCGNIGIPMLDILPHTAQDAYAIIELSSFQLAPCSLDLFTPPPPDVAVITNIYPNHLDYHRTMEAYVTAKCFLLQQQQKSYRCIMPLALAPQLQPFIPPGLSCIWFSATEPTAQERAICGADDLFYFIAEGTVQQEQRGIRTSVSALHHIPNSFPQNALIVHIALQVLGIITTPTAWNTLKIPAHRCTLLRVVRDISFFNDSKSTVPEATLSAVAQFPATSVVLFWGGMSKGVSRREATMQLAHKTRLMICFGKEAEELARWCTHAGGTALSAATVEAAITTYWNRYAQQKDIVLFSPGGTSYDLFKNFEERGRCFQALVESL